MIKSRELPHEWVFTERNRRPPRDPVNAMLSFGYALLVKECTTALLAEGLDPYWGLYHEARHGRPGLALDIMARKHFLVSYDISDDKRRTGVSRTLEGYGDRVQYSVFFCDLNSREAIMLQTQLTEWIENREDQVIILDLGTAETPLETSLECLGKPYEPPCRVQVV